MIEKYGELLFIVIFLIVSITISTWFSWQGSGVHITSMAYKVRSELANAVAEFNKEDQFNHCKQEALKREKRSDVAVIWYDDGVEYWCGILSLSQATPERLSELKGKTLVLNSKDNLRRINESNKHNSRPRNIQRARVW